MQTSLVPIRARVPHVLIAISLGKENAQADATCHFGISRIEALGSSDSGSQRDNVMKWSIRVLRIGGRRLHDFEEICILIEQRLIVGVEVCWRNSEFIGSSDFGRQRVGEILIRAHHVVASKIKRLSRQVRQLLIRIDLRTPLPQDRLKVIDGLVVCIERIRR